MLNTTFNSIHRFIVSGLTGAVVHFLVLISCKEILGFSIIISTTIAFTLASFVSFLLQKLWAFRNYEKGGAISRQVSRYLFVTILNVGLNALLMHILVNKFEIYYIVSQIITSGLIAIESYVLYKFVVFSPISKES